MDKYRHKTRKSLRDIVIDKAAVIYENEIYSMCKRICEKEDIDIEQLYPIIAYEKLGELFSASSKSERQNIVKDIRDDIILWDSSTFSIYKEKKDRTNSIISEGIKIQQGEFKCKKCGSKDCYPYNQQTRSADEGMTTFVICKCGTRSKC